MITLDDCVDLDRADPLAEFRQRFDLDDDLVYLDGNSLGPPLRSVKERVGRLLDEWRSDLIQGWFDGGWADLPGRVGRRLEPIVGAEPGSIVTCDSTSVNLYKMSMVACDLREGSILTDSGNFPTDRYVLGEVARRRDREFLVTEPEQLASAIQDGLAVVALTQVDFRTGRLHELGELTALAHDVGALVLCDLSHSAGVMPIDVAAKNVDLAVGCGYKYLNGGPGAPGYLYVAPRLAEEIGNPITGWFGHSDPFLFGSAYQPAPGTQRGSHVALRHSAAVEIMSDLAKRRVVGDLRPPEMMRFGFVPLFNLYTDAWRAAVELVAAVDARVSSS